MPISGQLIGLQLEKPRLIMKNGLEAQFSLYHCYKMVFLQYLQEKKGKRKKYDGY